MLTIGNFDGLHLGHQALIRRVLERGRELRVPAVVMTFEPHPVKVLHPDRHLQRIFDFEDQRQQLEQMGVDVLIVEPFSREFSQLPPERYLLEWIYRPFVPDTVVVGYDFSFGADRRGSIDFLKQQAIPLGFKVEVVPPVKVAAKTGEILVSSSRIRQSLQEGDVATAALLLGRPFHVSGLVERGAGRGRLIGVPTANVRTTAETIPGRGVYCGHVFVRDSSYPTVYPAVINVGLNPTFEEAAAAGQAMSVEAHLLDFGEGVGEAGRTDIYGEPIRIEFIERLRDERKFASVAELVAQIRCDIEAGRRILRSKDRRKGSGDGG